MLDILRTQKPREASSPSPFPQPYVQADHRLYRSHWGTFHLLSSHPHPSSGGQWECPDLLAPPNKQHVKGAEKDSPSLTLHAPDPAQNL